LILDVDWLKVDPSLASAASNNGVGGADEYDMIIHPSTVSVAPKGIFAINFMARA
jgi:hypothetical protein